MSDGNRPGSRLPIGRAAAAVALAAAIVGGGASAWIEVDHRTDASAPRAVQSAASAQSAASERSDEQSGGSHSGGSRHAEPPPVRPDQEPGTQHWQGRDTQPERDPSSEPRRKAQRPAASSGGFLAWLGSGLRGLPGVLARVEPLAERGYEVKRAARSDAKEELRPALGGEEPATAEETREDTGGADPEPAARQHESPEPEPAAPAQAGAPAPANPEPKRECTLPSNADPDRPGIQQAEVDELGPEWVSDETKREMARDMLC